MLAEVRASPKAGTSYHSRQKWSMPNGELALVVLQGPPRLAGRIGRGFSGSGRILRIWKLAW